MVGIFKKLLSRPVPLNPPDTEAPYTDLLIGVTPPTIKEIGMIIIQIKSRKAAGRGNIPAKVLKSDIEGKHGIQWTDRNQLEFLNFADELPLLSHTHEQIQMKTTSVAAASVAVGLNIHKYNTDNTNSITFDDETVEEVQTFTCLNSSIIDVKRGFDADVNARISKAKIAFLQLKNMWIFK
ncbi:unnamed protein product [Schistosoma curassoni]|uniref:Reverse transcriptase domain-containing protein n=1 Tax=Schistosoma curassoni TaxID=6186 RepID=A0A183K8V9_9TREM|nr:unnamed protein product [Schistosoma curassoni]